MPPRPLARGGTWTYWAAMAPPRGLVISNMQPDPASPGRGSFVRAQVAALRRRGAQVELSERPRSLGGYLRTAADVRRHVRARDVDVYHAHFGLSQWPVWLARGSPRVITLHGTDLQHPVSRLLTRALLRRMDLVSTASGALAELLPERCARRRVAVLPAGVDLERFRPIPRGEARRRLGLESAGPFLLFPADPARRVKRHDRARELARDVPLLSAGDVEPDDMPWLINAANAVLVPSDAEGFGLAVLEALACDVPVLATPVGVHPLALRDVSGALCAPYDRERWERTLEPHLASSDPRVAG